MATPGVTNQPFSDQPSVGMVLIDGQKSDTVDLTEAFRGIYIDAAAVGTLKMNLIDGSTIATSKLQPGRVHWFAIRRLWSIGTAQTGIHGVR